MQLEKYRERKENGLIRLIAVSPKKVIASSTLYNQLTGEATDTQEVFLNIDDLRTQRTQVAEAAEAQLAELDAVIADVEKELEVVNKSENKTKTAK